MSIPNLIANIVDSHIRQFNTTEGYYTIRFNYPSCLRKQTLSRSCLFASLNNENRRINLADLLRASFIGGYPIALSSILERLNLEVKLNTPRRNLEVRFWKWLRFLIGISFLRIENNIISFDRESYQILDPGEKTIISQTLGVLFAILSAEYTLGVSHFIYTHLLQIPGRGRFADFIGLSNSRLVILESKGTANSNSVYNFYNEAIEQINNALIKLRPITADPLVGYISITTLSESITTYLIDPNPPKILVNPDDIIFVHYLPILSFLIKGKDKGKLSKYHISGETFYIVPISNGLDIGLYAKFFEILEKGKFLLYSEFQNSYISLFKDLRESIQTKNIKNISLGLDGSIFIIKSDKVKPC